MILHLAVALTTAVVMAGDDAAEAVPPTTNSASSWVSSGTGIFKDVNAFRRACGTIMPSNSSLRTITEAVARRTAGLAPDEPFAPAFDSRTQWPECAPVIGHIRDQGMATCGSCFVFGPVQALQDKWCIKKKGNSSLLSVEDGLACSGAGSCSGGNPMAVMGYLSSVGVVTGGDYGETDQKTCLPYAVPPNGAVPPYKCPGTGSAGTCSETKYPVSWALDKHKGGSPYTCTAVSPGCMQACLASGPFAVSITVFPDLGSYKEGVYTCKGKSAGGEGHTIVIIGWGLEPPASTPYWLVKNSWGESWGDKGLFKVTRGINDCGIESPTNIMISDPT